MELHELKAPAPNKANRKRIGRGHGSGTGKQAGKGHKGQKQHGKGKVRIGFEGGQMPLQRRVPKFGFKNPFRTEYTALNLSVLSDAIQRGKLGSKVTLQDIFAANLADDSEKVKLLALGDINAKVEIEVHACSASAKEKIEKAGGTVTIVQ